MKKSKILLAVILPFLALMTNVSAFDFSSYQTATKTAFSLRNSSSSYGSTNCTSGSYCTLNFSSISTNPFTIDRINVQLLDTFNTSFSLNTYYKATLFFTQNPDLSVFYLDDLVRLTGVSFRNLSSYTSDELNISTWSLKNVDDDLHLYQLDVVFTLTNTSIAGFSFSIYYDSSQTFYTTTGYSMRIYRASKLENLSGSGKDYTQDLNNINNNINDLGTDITNNQNQNTQNIINNQNQNTQDIINNQNENTRVCNKKIGWNNVLQTGVVLGTNGSFQSGAASYGVTDYIPIDKGIKVTKVYNYWVATCFYSQDKTLISCIASSSMVLDSFLTIPNNAYYVRFTVNRTNGPEFLICTSGSQAINDSLTDDSVDGANNSASNFFSSFTTETYGLTSVITSPLTFIQSLTSKTCSSLVLPLPYVNRNLELPCMRSIYEQHFGGFLSIYQTITFGIISYWVVVRIFNLVKDFKNPDHDEIEVMDL